MKCLLLDDDHVPYEVDVDTWIEGMAEVHHTTPWPWRVAITEGDGWGVSTVFLGYDAKGGSFETLCSPGIDEELIIVRYPTWADAEAGHNELVNRLENP